jgi:U4/U6.U5 tri-snRNP-associated protein 1
VAAVAEEKEAEAAEAVNAIKIEEEVGLTIDDTSEFVQGISLEESKPEKRVMVIQTVQRNPFEESDEDEDMEELEAGEVDPEEEEKMRIELDKQFGNGDAVKAEDQNNIEVK